MIKKIKIISLLSLLVVTVIGTCFGISYFQSNDKTTDLIISSRLENPGITLKMSRLSNTNVGDVQITATVTPSNATNKALNWNLAWTETTDKNVSDYVTLSVSTTTHVATLKFIKSFDIPMTLNCTSVANPEITSSCDVDCYERTQAVTDAQLSMSLNDTDAINVTFRNEQYTDKTDEIIISGTSFASIFENDLVELNSITTSAVKTGTLNTTSNMEYSIGLNIDLQNLLEARNITFNSTGTSFNGILRVSDLIERLITFTSDNKETIYEALNTCDTWFTLFVEVEDLYHGEVINTYIDVFNIKGFDISDHYAEVNVTGISLDSYEIIF